VQAKACTITFLAPSTTPGHALCKLAVAACCRLEMESASRAELWQRCSTLEQELHGAQDALDATSKQLKQTEQQLGECFFGMFEQQGSFRASR
jgi:septal ring factor EnvC (AmiA/AmiB activator)